jgi:hypothetical protein
MKVNLVSLFLILQASSKERVKVTISSSILRSNGRVVKTVRAVRNPLHSK